MLNIINFFITAMNDVGELIKEYCSKIYFQKLLDYLFYAFYTKNEYLFKKLIISHNISSKYLHGFSEEEILI